jgi:hypothetical protein
MEGVASSAPKASKRKQSTTKAPRSALGGGKASAAKKKAPKPPKPPRNPFRRSDTGKLKLKCIQMRKRIETLTPRVEIMRERLDTTEARLNFLTGKVKFVDEELASRGAMVEVSEAETSDTELSDEELEELDNGGNATNANASNLAGEAETSDEDIELDDEIETPDV